ncbi:hypothetical protein ACP70R_012813 [Stipagrostis hirtigluma subsp. patula]
MVVSNDDDEFHCGGTSTRRRWSPIRAPPPPPRSPMTSSWTRRARIEIIDLRFSLEEAMRRSDEEAKAALERELRDELRKKHAPRRRAASFSEDAIRPALERAPWPRPTPTPRAPRSACPGGEDMPTPRCLTWGRCSA